MKRKLLIDFNLWFRVRTILTEALQNLHIPDIQKPNDEEVIYKQLESEADEGTYQEFYYKHHGGSNYGYVWGKQPEENSNDIGVRKESTTNGRNRNYAYLPYYADEEKGMLNSIIYCINFLD